MNQYQSELYQRIQAFSIDDPDAAYPFRKKLASENGWSESFTQQAIQEYKKFVFLAVACEHEVSPSDVIDRVWHLHLIYTESYWGEFCPNVLGISLHHNPSKGGLSEQEKYSGLFYETLESYQAFFGEIPPPDFWQDPHIEHVKKNSFPWKKILALFFIPMFLAGGKILSKNSSNEAHAVNPSPTPTKTTKANTQKAPVKTSRNNSGCGNGCGSNGKGCGGGK